jgi:hypothetical protein
MARIRAVYEMVIKRTRYVGLEFGIHGYQPYRVSQIFSRKFGDCKDKASLLVVMLKEAGIDASLVLARTRRGGDLAPEPASLAPFDHAIAYVPAFGLYLDGTAEFSGADELPSQDQDIPVLRVTDRKLVKTPVLPAARNLARGELRVALNTDGSAGIDETLRVAGQAASDWRMRYQAVGERQKRYDEAWNAKQPGAHVETVDMKLGLGQPVDVKAKVAVPRWARPDGDGVLAMPALGREPELLRGFGGLSTRRHDLVLGFPFREEERVVVKLPAHYTVKRLPTSRTLKNPYGTFVFTAKQNGNEVVVSAVLQLDKHRINRNDYPTFRTFLADIDAAVAQELVIATSNKTVAGGAR